MRDMSHLVLDAFTLGNGTDERPNVLPLCRGAEGDVGHERRVRGLAPTLSS